MFYDLLKPKSATGTTTITVELVQKQLKKGKTNDAASKASATAGTSKTSTPQMLTDQQIDVMTQSLDTVETVETTMDRPETETETVKFKKRNDSKK